jgi:hypothetical protein
MTEPEDEATRRQKIFDSALPPTPDMEDKLVALKSMVEARRKDPRAEERYEALRDDLAADLKEHGPRYLVDEDGDKYYAYAVAPEIVIADQQAIESMVEAGELEREEYERIYPRRLDKEALRRSIAKKRGGMTNAQVVRSVRFKPGTAYVKFDSPDETHEDYPG